MSEIIIYHADRRGTVAQRMVCRDDGHPHSLTYTRGDGRTGTIDREFVQQLPMTALPQCLGGSTWYGRQPFMVLPNYSIMQPPPDDPQRFLSGPLGVAYVGPPKPVSELPLRARYSRGLVRAQFSPEDLEYIAREIMPDEWGLDPRRKLVLVSDRELLVQSVIDRLNEEDEQGGTLISRCIEQALTQVMEQGDPGLEIEDIDETI